MLSSAVTAVLTKKQEKMSLKPCSSRSFYNNTTGKENQTGWDGEVCLACAQSRLSTVKKEVPTILGPIYNAQRRKLPHAPHPWGPDRSSGENQEDPTIPSEGDWLSPLNSM